MHDVSHNPRFVLSGGDSFVLRWLVRRRRFSPSHDRSLPSVAETRQCVCRRELFLLGD